MEIIARFALKRLNYFDFVMTLYVMHLRQQILYSEIPNFAQRSEKLKNIYHSLYETRIRYKMSYYNSVDGKYYRYTRYRYTVIISDGRNNL